MILTVVILYVVSFLVLGAIYLATHQDHELSNGIFDEWHERRRERATRSTKMSREDTAAA